MTPPDRQIFRVGAIEAYRQARAQSILPRLAAPRVALGLWVVLGLFTTAGLLIWLARVPVYQDGVAALVDDSGHAECPGEEVMVIAFFPPETRPKLEPGQRLTLNPGSGREGLHGQIMAVEPRILSPASARRQFNLDPAMACAVARPAAVVIARLESGGGQIASAVLKGSVMEAKVEVGSRRIVRLLPVVGSFFAD